MKEIYSTLPSIYRMLSMVLLTGGYYGNMDFTGAKIRPQLDDVYNKLCYATMFLPTA